MSPAAVRRSNAPRACLSRCSSSRRRTSACWTQSRTWTLDPKVLAHGAPGKARTGIERYFEVWERAVEVFGEGQVSTYVILGMGEDPELTVEGCRRAIDIGVYPFVVPLRPVAGSLMQDV